MRCTVEDVMTRDVVCAPEDTPLQGAGQAAGHPAGERRAGGRWPPPSARGGVRDRPAPQAGAAGPAGGRAAVGPGPGKGPGQGPGDRREGADEPAGDHHRPPGDTGRGGEAAACLGVKQLVVIDAEGRLVGVVSRADLLTSFLRSDEELHQEIVEDVIFGDLFMGPDRFDVHVQDGVVVLQGCCERRSLIPVVVRAVAAVDGVIRVENRLGYDLDDLSSPQPGALAHSR